MPHIKELFGRSALLKVLAANIRDGEALGIHPKNHFSTVAREVRDALSVRKGQGHADPDDYLIELEEVCFGSLPGRSGSVHLLVAAAPMPVDPPEWYTCVLTVTHWKKYLKTETIHKFAQAAKVPLPFVPMGGIEDVALYRLLTELRRGEFVPKADFSLGFPLVWITPRPAFEEHILSRIDRADAARDFLGLIHREEKEHLVAMHIPASTVKLVRSARPIFSDAGRHRRFMVEGDEVPPLFPTAWGQTLDLEKFGDNGTRASGAAERVCERIKIEHLHGVTIEFEYLGGLRNTRGGSGDTDDDFAARQVSRGHDDHARIVRQI